MKASGSSAAGERESDAPEDEGVLGELIAVEARVQAAIREAEENAARAIADAESEVSERARAADHDLEAAFDELRARLQAEQEAALAGIAAETEEAARRYLEVEEARIRELAELVVRHVAEGPDEADA